jgi:hypothetical protein
MIKRALINIANVLKSYVTNQDTKSKKAIHSNAYLSRLCSLQTNI